MSRALLKRYIGLAVRESQARVPTQLLEPDSGEASPAEDEASVVEFSGAGAAMGYVAPSGEQRKKAHKRKR
jgi:hypothetical protein